MLVAFAGLALGAAGAAIVRIDGRVATTLHAHATPVVTTGFQVVTQLGGTAVLVAVVTLAVAYLCRLDRRHDAAFLLLAFAGAEALTGSMKAIFRRERPSFDDPLATADSFSYPSGHALVAVAVYGAFAYLLLRVSARRPHESPAWSERQF